MLKGEIRSNTTLDFNSIYQIYRIYKFLSFIKIIYDVYLFSQVYKGNKRVIILIFQMKFRR